MDRRLFLVFQSVLLALLLGGAVLTLTSASSAAADVVASSSVGFLAVDGKSSGTAQTSPLSPAGSGFTYQGRLDVSGSPANGQFDLQFTLFDAASGGTQVGNPVTVLSQTVAGGLFTVQLDFGSSAFQGGARWLEVAVSPAGGGTYTTLAPRQPVSPAPYALSLAPGATVSETHNSPLLTIHNNTIHNNNQIGLQAYSQNHDGVFGISTVVGRSGVYGENLGGGFGVTGRNNSTNVFTPAVYGRNEAVGTGVFGWGGAYGVIGGSDIGTGVYAYSDAASGFGLYARTTGSGYGVFAQSSSGPGIYGTSTSNSGVQGVVSNTQPALVGTNNGSGIGVRGVANTGYAVSGTSTGSYGVYGSTAFTTSAGIYGTNTSGHGYGVRGFGGTIDGIGVFGSAGGVGVHGTSTGTAPGVQGVVSNTFGAVFGNNTGMGPGIRGQGTTGYGVYGNSNSGSGVYGVSSTSTGVWGGSSGTGAGVYGTSINGPGVRGYVLNNNSGVLGESLGNGEGVYGTSIDGVGVRGTSLSDYGVYAETGNIYLAGLYATNSSGRGYGVHASGGTVDGIGVYGTAGGSGGWFEATAGNGVYGSGTVNGVWGVSTGAVSSGVYGYNSGGGFGVAARSVATGTAFFADNLNNLAGNFRGNVTVQGSLSKGGGSFKIDHPLDPENKYLYHSFVESPDMMNVYNGNVTLDSKGEATVELPVWFEALNKEFRYQLTAIGAPGPDLYVAQEVKNNRFKIAGGKAGMKVSWQVTGIRHDPYAEQHRIPVEEAKPAGERSKYLYPDAYGKPESQSIGYDKSQELTRRSQAPVKLEPPATEEVNR
jgi:hypothetical protein